MGVITVAVLEDHVRLARRGPIVDSPMSVTPMASPQARPVIEGFDVYLRIGLEDFHGERFSLESCNAVHGGRRAR